jgi:hypothetical protein
MVEGETGQRLHVMMSNRSAASNRSHAARSWCSNKGCPAAHRQVYGVHVVRPLALRPAAFCGNELDPHHPSEARGGLVLHVENVGAWRVETLGPEVRTGRVSMSCALTRIRSALSCTLPSIT